MAGQEGDNFGGPLSSICTWFRDFLANCTSNSHGYQNRCPGEFCKLDVTSKLIQAYTIVMIKCDTSSKLADETATLPLYGQPYYIKCFKVW
jgi:hypothetical protein